MMSSGGWSLRNLFQGPTFALFAVFVGALILIGVISFTFRGNIVV